MQNIIIAAMILLFILLLPVFVFAFILLSNVAKMLFSGFRQYHLWLIVPSIMMDVCLSEKFLWYHSNIKLVLGIPLAIALIWSGWDNVRKTSGKKPVTITYLVYKMAQDATKKIKEKIEEKVEKKELEDKDDDIIQPECNPFFDVDDCVVVDADYKVV